MQSQKIVISFSVHLESIGSELLFDCLHFLWTLLKWFGQLRHFSHPIVVISPNCVLFYWRLFPHLPQLTTVGSWVVLIVEELQSPQFLLPDGSSTVHIVGIVFLLCYSRSTSFLLLKFLNRRVYAWWPIQPTYLELYSKQFGWVDTKIWMHSRSWRKIGEIYSSLFLENPHLS